MMVISNTSDYEKAESLFYSGQNVKAYEMFGSFLTGVDTWTFRVWAPKAKGVCVAGDFNGWSDENPMFEITPGVFECTIENLHEGDLYKYRIETASGEILFKADPYAKYFEVRPGTASRLYDLKEYKWKDARWLTARKKKNIYASPMNIYEVHLGSWKTHEDGSFYTYNELRESLVPYVKEMGYTHVEIMPVAEYPYDASWGYQEIGYYAPTSRYGTPDEFRALIEAFHKENIGVIMDWVPAHFPKDACGLYHFNGEPLYEYTDPLKGEHKQWGTMVFDFGRAEVRSFLISNALYWMDEYHIDGLRIDAVASMLYLDYGIEDGNAPKNIHGGNEHLEAVEFLQMLNSAVLSKHPDTLMIAEESTAWPKVTYPPYEGGLGFNFKWNMGWMNDMLSYVSADPYFRKDMHHNVTFSMTYAFSENYVLPLSHDEVVYGKRSLLSKMFGSEKEKFSALKAFYGYMIAHPGKKLMFMGGEFAQKNEWDFAKALAWDECEKEKNKQFIRYVKKLNAFYASTPALWEKDTSWEGFEWNVVDDNMQNIVSFSRFDEKGNEVVAIINFSPVPRTGYRIGARKKGAYTMLFHSELKAFGGEGSKNASIRTANIPMHGLEQSIRVNIPANSVMFLAPAPVKDKKAGDMKKKKRSGKERK